MMCSVVIWTLMSALESGSVGLAKKLLFSQLGYIGTTTTAPLFFLFVLRYRNRELRLRASLVALLFALPMATLALAFTGVLLLIGMTRYRLFDLVPVARDVLVEKMVDGLVVLDATDRVLDVNPSARAMLDLASSVVGTRPGAHVELELPGASPRHCDMRVSPLVDRRGNPAGRLLLIRDVTERRKVELERERLIGELREAIADIRTLRGLLPSCASCKKIRDDEGYWRNLEQYVTAHSEAQFSHGLCPDYADREPGGSPR